MNQSAENGLAGLFVIVYRTLYITERLLKLRGDSNLTQEQKDTLAVSEIKLKVNVGSNS